MEELERPGVPDDTDTHEGPAAAAGEPGVQRPLGAAEAAGLALHALEAGGRAVTVTRMGPDPRRRILTESPQGAVETVGSLGSPEVNAEADVRGRGLLAGTHPEGVVETGGVRLYLEAHSPAPELVIVGAGHIAQPLSSLGALLGFQVTVADDRAGFATRERFPQAHRLVLVDFDDPFDQIPPGPLTHLVLVTRGHQYDFECLRRLLLSDARPRYVGMIGSRRRVRATFERLLADGIPRERLEAVRAPVGLDLGAQSPAEIAVSVAAELVLEWRGGVGSPLHKRERVLERFFPVEVP